MPRSRPPATEPAATEGGLTVSQRVLLCLPNLQRQHQRRVRPAAGTGTDAGTDAGRVGSGTGRSGAATVPAGRTSRSPQRATGAKPGTSARPAAATKPAATTPATTTPAATTKAATTTPATTKAAAAKRATTTPATTTKRATADISDAGGTAAAAPASFGTRLRDSLLKPKPAPKRGANGKVPTKQDPFPDKTSAELKRWLKHLDDQERMLTLVAAPLAAVISVAGIFYRLGSNPAAGKTGYIAPSTIMTLGGVGVALAIAVLAGGLTRRRSFAVFALFFAGFPISFTLGIFGVLPFWGLGFWLFQRSSKMQRSLTHRGDHPRQQRGRGGGTGRASGGRTSAGRAGATSGRSRGKKAPEPAGPTPNKRYTPPKPREETDR